MKKNKIISIQSKLVYGYVGSNVAELAIQLHGIDTISFPTVLLATHTGHKPIYGRAIEKDRFEELVKGIEALGVIKDAFCLMTGYIGSEDILESASKFVKRIKSNYPNILYICDPVMGDVGRGLYVPEKVASKLQEDLIPFCDIMTPNHFEIETILGHKADTIESLIKGISKHSILSSKTLVITSCELKDTPEGKIETVIVKEESIDRVVSKRIDIQTTGTGDLFSALLAAQLTQGENIAAAVKETMHIISNCLDYVLENKLEEMNAECLIRYIRK